MLQLSTDVELLQYGSEVVYIKVNLLLCHDLRDAFQRKLIVGVERQVFYIQLIALLFYLVNLLFYAHEIFAFDKLGHQAHQLTIGVDFLTVGSCIVMDYATQLINQSLYLGMMVFFLLGKL